MPFNWIIVLMFLGLAGLGAIAWALPDKVDILGRSRKMMGGTLVIVSLVFAVLAVFGIYPTR